MFGTLQGRLPAELALHGITTMDAANTYLRDTYQARHNREFTVAASDLEPAFIPYVGLPLADILCLQEERIVGKENTVSYQGKILQIQASAHRHHYVKAEVTICHYPDDRLAIFHGHQCLARFDKTGLPTAITPPAAATPEIKQNQVVYHGDKCSGAPRLHTYPHDNRHHSKE